MQNNYTTNPSATNPEKAKFVASLASQNYKGPSITDYLNLSGYDSSQSSRQQLGAERGISGIGTAQGNTSLLEYMRSNGGEVRAPGENYQNPNRNQQFGNNAGGNPQPQQSPADMAFAEYLKSLQPSDEEKQAKTYVDNLVANSKLARERALNSGETMGFAGGEAQRVGRNNDLTIDAANSTYQTVKSFRDREGIVGKAKYEYEKGKETQKRADAKALADENKPFELSPGQKRYTYNKATGKYELTASSPKDKSTSVSTAEENRVSQKALDTDVNDIISQLVDHQTKNKHYGVDQTGYEKAKQYLRENYQIKGVDALNKAMAAMGLAVDKVGDDVGGI